MPLRRSGNALLKKLDEARDAAQQNIPAQNLINQFSGGNIPPGGPSGNGFPPAPHDTDWADVTDTPTTLSGYGITDAAGIGEPYLVVSLSAALTSERRLVGGSGITLTDGGAGGDLTIDATGGGTGTVTSVGLTAPAEFSVTNSPITTSGDIVIDWAAPVTLAHGGTGADLSATGGAHQIVRQNSAGGTFTVSVLAAADIPNLAESQITGLVSDLNALAAGVAASQPLDGDLTAIAALGSTGLAARTAANTWAQRSIAGTSNRIAVTNGDGVSGNPTLDIDAAYGGQTSITTLGTIATGTWSATAIDAAHGGTGQSSYAVGDLLYASGSAALSKLADVATGNVLLSGGVTTAPAWGKVGLTTHVSGVLPIANGGTGVGAIPVFSVHKNGTTQPIAGSGAFVKLTWSTEEFDSHSDFASDKFTPTIAGTYMLCASVGVNSLIARMVLTIYKNGVEHKRVADFANSLGGSGAAMVQANGSTDFFEIYVLNSAAVTVGGAATATNFTGAWVGA